MKGYDVTGKRRYLLDFSIDELENGKWTIQLNARNIFGTYDEIVLAIVKNDESRARAFIAETIDPSMRGLIEDQRAVRQALGV